jgi:hypothetical protein
MNGYFNLTYDFTNNQKWLDVALKTKSKLQDVQIMAIEIMTIAYSSLNRNEFKYEYLGVCCFKYNLSKVRVKKIFQEFLNCNFISKKNENIFYLTDYLKYQSNIKNYQNRTQESQEISKEDKRKQQIREAQARFRSNQKVINSNQIVITDNQTSNQSVIKSNQDIYIYQKEQEQDKEQEIKEKKTSKKEFLQTQSQIDKPSFYFSEKHFERKEKVNSVEKYQIKNSDISENDFKPDEFVQFKNPTIKENLTVQTTYSEKPNDSTCKKSSQVETLKTQFNRLIENYPNKKKIDEAFNIFKSKNLRGKEEQIKSSMSAYISHIKREQKKATEDYNPTFINLQGFFEKEYYLKDWRSKEEIEEEEKEKKRIQLEKKWGFFDAFFSTWLEKDFEAINERKEIIFDKKTNMLELIEEKLEEIDLRKYSRYGARLNSEDTRELQAYLKFKVFLDNFFEEKKENQISANFALIQKELKKVCNG